LIRNLIALHKNRHPNLAINLKPSAILIKHNPNLIKKFSPIYFNFSIQSNSILNLNLFNIKWLISEAKSFDEQEIYIKTGKSKTYNLKRLAAHI